MKILLSIILCFSFLTAWEFTDEDYDNLDESQLDLLKMSYIVGEEKSLGYTLQAIAIVENYLLMKDNNKNHICGPHQLNINFTLATCRTLENNSYASSKLALKNLLLWKRKYPGITWKKMLIYYNGGDKYFNPHGKEFVRRVTVAYAIVTKRYIRN